MSAEKPKKEKQNRTKQDYRWLGTVFGLTVAISGAFSFISGELLEESGIVVSFIVLLAIILIGVIFDVIGISVAAANEQPFHSMAARKVSYAPYALRLLRKADHVSSFCNDVIGDICGIISGTAAAAIAANAFSAPVGSRQLLIANLVFSATIAGLTVGGKAFGKTFAINNSTEIVSRVASVLCFFGNLKPKSKRN